MKKITTKTILPVTPGLVEQKIRVIRGQKVMSDKDLAELYQVPTGNLNRAVQRNIERFPRDFMFKLTKDEALRCQFGILDSRQSPRFQIGTLKPGKHIKYLPYAFTELGVAMLSSVLNSDRAVQVNIYIMRAFVKLREIMATNEKVAQKIHELEQGQKENTEAILEVAGTLEQLMDEGANQKDAIGFVTEE